LSLPRGVTFQRASGADAQTTKNGSIDLKLGSLFAGDERRVLLEMDTDLTASDDHDELTFASDANWDRVGGAHASVQIVPLKVTATNDRDAVEKGRDPSVLASAASVTASRRQMEAADAYNRGDVRTAETLADESMNELRAAATAAPAPMASALSAQAGSYEHAKSGFRRFAPASTEAKALSKTMVKDDSANMARKAY